MAIILQGAMLGTDVATLRRTSTSMPEFRHSVHRIGLHLAVEASKLLPTKATPVVTPLEETTCNVLDGSVVVIPILRSGLGLLDPFLTIIPSASVGYIGLRRNEDTLQPYEYYRNLPPIDITTTVIVIDPMLATGGSMIATLQAVTSSHTARSILAVCLIAAPEGVAAVEQMFPNVTIVAAALDRELNSVGYIVPGLGDAGDRQFGT